MWKLLREKKLFVQAEKVTKSEMWQKKIEDKRWNVTQDEIGKIYFIWNLFNVTK